MKGSAQWRSPESRMNACCSSPATRPTSNIRSPRFIRSRSIAATSIPSPKRKLAGVASPCSQTCWSCHINGRSRLRDRWRERPLMWQDQQVWLHGDATPANFLFGDGMDVAAIDLERMKRGDRMFDVGRVAGELQHAFMRDCGDRRRADPFIGHFLQEYSGHFPDRQGMFESVTTRAPYYMALNLLRIARNGYIDADYSGRLVRQAKRLLR